MKKNTINISAVGITSCIGQGKENFFNALIQGQSNFDRLKRPGRQTSQLSFIGAEILDMDYSAYSQVKRLRNISLSGQVALITLKEAWDEAGLDEYDARRIGLIVGGSNIQQRYLFEIYERYRSKPHFLNPTYGFSFFDSDLAALCSQQFNIKGPAYTIGGSSASGQLAIIEAVKALQTEQIDICIVIGALMDLSYWELQGFKAIGAMGSDTFKDLPLKACRPYDLMRDGFIYGENCGAIVLEKRGIRNDIKPYARLAGCAIVMDANRNPNPCYEGELQAIKQALDCSKLPGSAIDYINPHGTGSPLGDETELRAFQEAKLEHALINSTKSIIGHGLTSAGTVEVIATLLQMKNGVLHPCLNLEEPIQHSFNWIKEKAFPHPIKHALTLSMGFGGINTALCIENNI